MEVIEIGRWIIEANPTETMHMYSDEGLKPIPAELHFCVDAQIPSVASIVKKTCLRFGVNPNMPFGVSSFLPVKGENRFTGTVEYLLIGKILSGIDLGETVNLDAMLDINNVGVGFSTHVRNPLNYRPILKLIFFGEIVTN